MVKDRNEEDLLFGKFSYVPFQTLIKNTLKMVGVVATHFSSHSLRRGAAQHLDECGVSSEDIRRAGRWNSDAFREYLGHCWAHAATLAHAFERQ